MASGLANTALVALVNQVINADAAARGRLLPLFLGICVLFPLLRYVGDYLLIFLTEKATLHLRLTLCGRMLAVPLRTLEEMGAGRLNATLLNDLPSVIGAMTLIPLLTLNVTIVTGSLVYMGFLSWQMLLGVLVFLVLGVVAYQVPLVRGHGHIRALRERGDELFRHFRSLTDGIKELKLHHDRRRGVPGRAAAGRGRGGAAAQRGRPAGVLDRRELGAGAHLPAHRRGGVRPSRVGSRGRPVLTGFTFAILYMVGPVQVVLNSMAQLSRATVAMDRVEEMGLRLAESARPDARLPEQARVAAWHSLQLDGVTHTLPLRARRLRLHPGPHRPDVPAG